jgi:hypothetical protein
MKTSTGDLHMLATSEIGRTKLKASKRNQIKRFECGGMVGWMSEWIGRV